MAVGSITSATYGSVTTQTESITLDIETRAGSVEGNVEFSFLLNLDPESTPEVQTITVVSGELPGATGFYRVEVAGPGATEVFVTEVTAGATAAAVASRLAQLINLHPEVQAVSDGGDIVVTALQPGTNGEFVLDATATLAADNSAISGAMTVATTTAAAGTGKMRQIATGRLQPVIEPSGSRRFQVQLRQLRFWNGAETPVQVSESPTTAFSHPRSVDGVRADNA